MDLKLIGDSGLELPRTYAQYILSEDFCIIFSEHSILKSIFAHKSSWLLIWRPVENSSTWTGPD